MSEPSPIKPRPARLSEVETRPANLKPTPARALSGLPAPEPPHAPESPPTEERTLPDVDEVRLEAAGGDWSIRVLGRGGEGGRSAPLLLLGFFEASDPGGPPVREALVVARRLADLGDERLEAALATASPPPPTDKRKPFFEGAGQGRRGGVRGDG